MALADLDGEQVVRAFDDDLSGKNFEEFFRRLLETERSLRHVVGTTDVDGPMKAGKADGGKDSVLRVNDAPRTPREDFEEPLSWDDLGKTYYSLKRGANWAQSVHDDVGYSGSLTGAKKDTEPKAPKSGELLQHIVDGGRYIVVVCAQEDDGEKTLAKIRKALRHHFDANRLTPPLEWESRVNFFDANNLASFVRHHRPILPPELETRLGLDWPQTLDRYESWTDRLRLDGREATDYAADSARNSAVEVIQSSQAARVLRVFGPPGVGKTRLIHHALAERERAEQDLLIRPSLASSLDSVYYTENPGHAEDVIFSPWIKHGGSGITLVVDEVTSAEVEGLARNFLTRTTDSDGRLILIGMTDEDVQEGLDHPENILGIRLGPLDDAAARRLITSILGENPVQVNRVEHLAEGYPWFAVRLARALLKDGDALSGGSDEASRWQAAKRVLAGPRVSYSNTAAWGAETTRRALCLLAVMMTHGQDLDWDQLWHKFGDDFRAVIAETCGWEQVKNAHADCVKHGLLRRVGKSNRRYVSPANLARMILNHFFGDGDGPDFGVRLAKCDPVLQDHVNQLASRYEASNTVRDKLSTNLLDEAEALILRGESIAKLVDARDSLYIAAGRFPDQTARVLSAAICNLEFDALAKQESLRHGLRGIFQDLVQAKLSPSTFRAAEAALFAMARVEDEAWSNNATGIWRSLFLTFLSQTHQPWDQRFEILSRRCREGADEARVLAVSGLKLTVTSDERGVGHAPGRVWPQPSQDEAVAQKREAWDLLLEQCATEAPSVAAAARTVVAATLRGCIMDNIVVDLRLLGQIGDQLERWTVAQRRDLAETLNDVERYDLDIIPAAVRDALQRLQGQLEASDFGERLAAQVGSWHPGKWQINDPDRESLETREDESLAKEAMAEPELLIAQWPWLGSAAAHRRRSFVRTVGRLDTDHRFLPSLEAIERQPHAPMEQLLPWYVEGWAQADPAGADGWLAGQLRGGPCEVIAGFVLPWLQPSDQRLEWLLERVKRGTAHAAALSNMRARWVDATDPKLMLRLVEACSHQPDFVPPGISLLRALLKTEVEPALLVPALEVAGTLLKAATKQRLPALQEFDWSSLLNTVASHGQSDAAVDALLSLATSNSNIQMGSLIERSFRALLEQDLGEKIWARAQADLDDNGTRLGRYLGRVGLLGWLSVRSVLGWVGTRQSRGATAMYLVSPYGESLHDVARELLVRFGDLGPVAETLSARVRSTPRAVNSLLDFKRRQLDNVERWALDSEPTVQRWALGLAAQLREAIAEDVAHAEFRRKLG